MSDGEAKAQTEPDIVNDFIREMEDGRTILHTNRVNGLGCYDTHSWGDTSKRVLAAALRDWKRMRNET